MLTIEAIAQYTENQWDITQKQICKVLHNTHSSRSAEAVILSMKWPRIVACLSATTAPESAFRRLPWPGLNELRRGKQCRRLSSGDNYEFGRLPSTAAEGLLLSPDALLETSSTQSEYVLEKQKKKNNRTRCNRKNAPGRNCNIRIIKFWHNIQ